MKLCERTSPGEYQEFSLLEVLNDIGENFKLKNQKINLKFFNLNIVSTGLANFLGDEPKIRHAFYCLFEKIFENTPKKEEKIIRVEISYTHNEKHYLVFNIYPNHLDTTNLLNSFFKPQVITYIEEHGGEIDCLYDYKSNCNFKIILPFNHYIR